MGNPFKPDKPKIKQPPPPPVPEDTEAIAEAAMRERLKKRRGRAGTILTSGMGVAEEPTILSKKLLGA